MHRAKGFGVEKEESRRVYEAFREAGGNFIDTANGYSGGRSEEFLGEFLAGDRDRVVLATKFTIPMRGRDVNAGMNSRKNMRIANDSAFRLEMEFRQGDIHILNNHIILHARTAYEDFDEEERKRHLLRLWLSVT